MRPMPRRPLGAILEGQTPVPCADAELLRDWLMDYPARVVALTALGPGVQVSTVFVVHGTNLFDARVYGGLLDGYGHRVATWAEAVQQHANLVTTCLPWLPVGTKPVAILQPPGYCPGCLEQGYGRISRQPITRVRFPAES